MLSRLAAAIARHPWRVVGIWALVVLGCALPALGVVGEGLERDRLEPGGPARRLADLRGDPVEGELVAPQLDGVALDRVRVEQEPRRRRADVAHRDHLQRYVPGHRQPDHDFAVGARGQVAGQVLHEKGGAQERGPRGSGEFREITWDEALSLAVSWLKPIRETAPETLAFFTGRDQSQSFTGLWAQAFGTPNYAAHGGFCSVNMAAAGISRHTDAIAIVISQTSGTVRVFRHGRAVLELAPRLRRS